MTKSSRFDVTVIGGGPCGLWVACELKLAGVNVCVLERRTERMSQSRSLTIHGRTLEMFELRGLHTRFLAQGRSIRDWHFAGLPARLDFSGFDASYPFMLFIAQTKTEQLLEERALELGVEIRRGVTVENVSQSEQQCIVTTTSGERFASSYVIGADGARSMVRRDAGITFEGVAASQFVMMADAQVDLPGNQPMLSTEGESGGLTILPLGNGLHRIIRLDFERSHIGQDVPLLESELRDSIIRMMGHDLNLRNASWLTRFSDETRVASAYRRERIFLIGDAAHIHAPMGGQGLNVGLQDAMNLGWKMAAVLQERAPQALLDSYETERRPVGMQLAENTLAQVALVSNMTPTGQALRKTLSRFLLNPSLNRELAGEISGFDLTYPEPLPGFDRPPISEQSIIGTRVPKVNLEDGKWMLIARDANPTMPMAEWLEPGSLNRNSGGFGADNERFQNMQAVLVRPDGYVGMALKE